jgi:hypothetical protein
MMKHISIAIVYFLFLVGCTNYPFKKSLNKNNCLVYTPPPRYHERYKEFIHYPDTIIIKKDSTFYFKNLYSMDWTIGKWALNQQSINLVTDNIHSEIHNVSYDVSLHDSIEIILYNFIGYGEKIPVYSFSLYKNDTVIERAHLQYELFNIIDDFFRADFKDYDSIVVRTLTNMSITIVPKPGHRYVCYSGLRKGGYLDDTYFIKGNKMLQDNKKNSSISWVKVKNAHRIKDMNCLCNINIEPVNIPRDEPFPYGWREKQCADEKTNKKANTGK